MPNVTFILDVIFGKNKILMNIFNHSHDTMLKK